MRKIFLLFIVLFFSISSYAVNCPSIAELKHLQLQNWQAFTTDNGTPLTATEMQDFTQEAKQFVMAEWADGAPEGEAHCYYINDEDSYTLAFLAQHHLKANMADQHWFKTSGFDRCVENDPSACPFSRHA